MSADLQSIIRVRTNSSPLPSCSQPFYNEGFLLGERREKVMGQLGFIDKELIVVFIWNKPLSEENYGINIHVDTAFTNRTVNSSELRYLNQNTIYLKPPVYNRIRNSNRAE